MPLIGAGFQGFCSLIYWHTNAAPPIKGIFIFKNMESKHTPGPYTKKNLTYKVEGANVQDHWVLGPNGEELACPENEADADLFVASPDLLKELKNLVGRIEYYANLGTTRQINIEDWAYTEGSADMANARAAIAKAETV